MSTETLLRQAVKGALALGSAGTMIGAGAALAQTAAPAAGTKLSNIVVTGSHIPQTSIATAQPVITINRQEIDNSGYTSVGQLLQSLSAAGPALNTQFNNGGNGSVFFDLHNLGSQRVLVLVNGQRWLPTLGGSVDVSTIPTAIVDRIEVLMDGASAVYGSEAMAGVINIITIQNYNGAQAGVYTGIYDGKGDGGGWDGKVQEYYFTVGTSGDRSAVMLSASYRNANPVWAGQRTISKEPYAGTGNEFGSSGSPNGRFVFYDPNYASYGNPAACSKSAALGYPGCDFTGPINPTNPFQSAPFTQGFNYAPQNYLLTPQELYSIYSQGHYDLTDNITFNFTTTYQRRNSSQVLAPNPWFFGLAGTEFVNGPVIGVAANNPYYPYGKDLVPGFPSYGSGAYFCQNYGSPTCSTNYETLFFFGRRPNEVGNRVFTQNVSTFYFNGGFTGYWEMFGNEWNWNANYIYGNTLETDLTTGLASTTQIANALGTQCPTSPGCVPLNIFGGAGTITKPMANYVLFDAHDITSQTLRDYNANIGGSFFNGWYAGPWGAAAGYEYDEFDGFFQPDALIAAGNTVGNAVKPTNGREKTDAEYAELNIPLASNMPFARELGIDIANRWSQATWNGIGSVFQNGAIVNEPASGSASDSTGRVTFKWKPIDQLLFRGTWAAGFRIPAISDLFSGAADNYPSLVDPCAPGPFGGWNGIPADLPPGCNGMRHSQPNGQIHTTVGGNPALQPEKSISQSLGFVWSPDFVQGLDFSADYYKIVVVNQITRLGGQFYLNQCYYNSDQAACNKITVAGGTVRNVTDTEINAGSFHTNGWDVGLRYQLPTTPVGDFTVNLNMNFVKFLTLCSNSGECRNVAGTGSSFSGTAKHKYNLGVNWDYGPWAATWNVYLIGDLYEPCKNSVRWDAGNPTHAGNPWCSNVGPGAGYPTGEPTNHLGTTVYNDVQGSYTVSSWNTTFTLGIQNLFDKSPPIAATAFGNSFFPSGGYRIPGRFFYGRVTVNF